MLVLLTYLLTVIMLKHYAAPLDSIGHSSNAGWNMAYKTNYYIDSTIANIKSQPFLSADSNEVLHIWALLEQVTIQAAVKQKYYY